jgi:hypothetical protein
VGEARAIAACHASRGEVDLARERLLTLAASRAWACVPSRDRRSVLADLDAWALP